MLSRIQCATQFQNPLGQNPPSWCSPRAKLCPIYTVEIFVENYSCTCIFLDCNFSRLFSILGAAVERIPYHVDKFYPTTNLPAKKITNSSNKWLSTRQPRAQGFLTCAFFPVNQFGRENFLNLLLFKINILNTSCLKSTIF